MKKNSLTTPFYAFWMALMMLFGSCHPSSPTVAEIATSRFEGDFELFPNETGQFVLCVKSFNPTPSALNPETPFRFFVYSEEAKTVVFEDRITNGSVVWKGTFTLVVTEISGAFSTDPNESRGGYTLDVRTGRSMDPIQ